MTATQWVAEAEDLLPELAELRREFHRFPETGNNEFRTAAGVELRLQSCGIETKRLTDTAIVGVLHGKYPGKTVALRADMDALPVTETTGCSFASQNQGVMHACGHDVHMTAALGAAELLSRHKDELAGTVKFFFEPDEEGNGGAQRMIAAGCMENVSAVFGAHVSPVLPVGTVGFKYGRFYAASAMFDVKITGKSAHGAEPENGLDALATAAEAVCRVRELNNPDRKNRLVVSVGSFQSGTARNIIAAEAEFHGMIRTLGPELRQEICDRLTAIIQATAAKYGTTADIRIRMSYTGVTNTDPETKLAEAAARAALGDDHVIVLEEPTMTTEDVGCFIAASSGCFYHIGAGCTLPLHNSGFLPDEKAISTAAGVHAAVLSAYLEAHRN